MASHFQYGLYDELFEKGSCGVGLVVNAQVPASHERIEQALQILKNLSHRSALGADGATSDGAGILCQIPDRFFREQFQISGSVSLPEPGQYAVAQIFVPKESNSDWKKVFEKTAHDLGFQVLAWRDVPVQSEVLGEQARRLEPRTVQAFLADSKSILKNEFHWEQDLFLLRRKIEKSLRNSSGTRDPQTGKSLQSFYICSLSRFTIVYKGLMRPKDMASYFLDLKAGSFESQMAMVHGRFSTNTMPAWELAQPFRFACHNGEINTIQGNRNWMKSRQLEITQALSQSGSWNLGPLLSENASDSKSLDEALEILLLLGHSTPAALMALIPEPWEDNSDLPAELRAFYEFFSKRLEPWDGPAAICFTNGKTIGASLDRNGLRPCRYLVLADGTLVAGSEAGALEVPSSQVLQKGRLKPGQLLIVDLATGEMDLENKTKKKESLKKPYPSWNRQENLQINLPCPTNLLIPDLRKLSQFGFHYDEIQQVLLPMIKNHEEATSSMGSDTPIALLSDQPQLLFHYFRQLFAQVTNPPIDPIRERSVMSLQTYLGSRASWAELSSDGKKRWPLPQPILSSAEILQLYTWGSDSEAPLKTGFLDCRFDLSRSAIELEKRLETLCHDAEKRVLAGNEVLVLSDRLSNEVWAAIPSLLIVSAVHHHLIQKQIRTRVSLVVETGEARDVHQTACLLSFGADAIHPYLIEGLIHSLRAQEELPADLTVEKAWSHYTSALNKGLLKILSKLGISTLQSYCGAQTFEILGISKSMVDKHFAGAVSRIQGLTMASLFEETKKRWEKCFQHLPGQRDISLLSSSGDFHFRIQGEKHHWSPLAIAHLQHATKTKNPESFRQFSEEIRRSEKSTLRGHLEFRKKDQALPLEQIQSAVEIVKRFTTGAMSLGALGREAHETLALAMNQLGAQSNSGEGGEDSSRYQTPRNSSIKQIASARFGVTTRYLVHAKELQIKMAQGAKPGEGGQLPGHKVNREIAKLRYSVPGVTLISPPPHHDIYSIEDLAQLIFDLKNVNPHARVSVKLVSKPGVGTIAAGVAKAGADKILISGDGGGTGASPLSSIRHAGIPWELGLAETHQTLVLNGLREHVRLETDGQLRTGRDVAIAAILGADEFGFSTAPLVVEGCLMMRKCHLNTCPVGIATQDPELRRQFKGQPEHVINYFFFVAEELREIMAQLGVQSLQELRGRTDLLKTTRSDHWKAKDLDLSALLVPVHCLQTAVSPMRSSPSFFDQKLLVNHPGLLVNTNEALLIPVRSTDRAIGTWLSGKIARLQDLKEFPQESIRLTLHGSAGQSFGAFLISGLILHLHGEANDYVGKGLSGGQLIVQHDSKFTGPASESILVGNTCLYGATAGQAYIAGSAGERFAVRNSGALAVVEGVGDHGCEYMTGGCVIVLGKTGKNFAAGMSGGLAFVWDPENRLHSNCNHSLVDMETIEFQDEAWLRQMIQDHFTKTSSARAHDILSAWTRTKNEFKKILPKEFRQILKSPESRPLHQGLA